jgi:hypothetical protein
MSRTIKQSIYDLLNTYQPFPKLITEHKDAIDQALKEIHDLIVESLPEAIGEQDEYTKGFNRCHEMTKANLLKILGGEVT